MSPAPLGNGQSEIDTVVLRLPDYGKEIKNWSRYTYTQAFLVPCPAWSFSVSDEDTTLTSELLVPEARVELVLNGRVQCSGFIDKKTVESGAQNGTVVTVQGRDILGPVVRATMDPIFKFTSGISVPELVATVLKPFGIAMIYNADLWNLSVITGYEKGSGGGQSTVKARVQRSTPNADGTVTLSYDTSDATIVISSTRPDLKALTVQDAKPHAGEGCYAYLERLLRRLGLTLWAAADGSAVIIDKADFTSAPRQKITRKRTDPRANNVLRGVVETDWTSQPSCIVATGFGGGKDVEKSKLRVIMVNELVGLDDTGKPLPEVANIIARYKGAKLLPVRSELVPFRRPLGDQKIARPFFLKDDESKNLAQLESFTRREMANRQGQALTATYDVVGHTFDGHPWAVNTNIAVEDEVLDVSRTMWLRERTFTKTPSGGTTSTLKLILPYALQIAT